MGCGSSFPEGSGGEKTKAASSPRNRSLPKQCLSEHVESKDAQNPQMPTLQDTTALMPKQQIPESPTTTSKPQTPKPQIPTAQTHIPKPQTPKPQTPKPQTPTLQAPMAETPRSQIPTPQTQMPESKIPKAQTPKPESPKPESPKPQTPKPQTPKPQTPKPQIPTPQTPTPQTPTPQTPTPQTPTPQTPTPQTPKPQTPTPQTPTPQTPTPQTPTPQKPPGVNNEQSGDPFVQPQEACTTDIDSDMNATQDEQHRLAEAQKGFDAAVRCACLLTTPKSVLEFAHKDVCCLQLQRSLPHTMTVFSLMQRLPHLQELDLAENQMGPQAFRVLMFGIAYNQTIIELNVANNHTDTDCAESVGIMLKNNSTLISLNLGGNYLGKDYLSRCIGPALALNKTLQHLNCEGVGSVDFSTLVEGACIGCTLVTLNLSNNIMSKTESFLMHIVAWLQHADCCLSSLDLKSCGLKEDDLITLLKGLTANTSITSLNIADNQISTTNDFVEFLIGCLSCPSLTSLVAENLKAAAVTDVAPGDKLPATSAIRNLKLCGCQLVDGMMDMVMTRLPENGLQRLEDLNLSNNSNLTIQTLRKLLNLTKGLEGSSSLEKLSYGQNIAEELVAVLGEIAAPKLTYLNLRRSKMSPAAVLRLGMLTRIGGLETVILDNIKIAGTDCIKYILAGGKECSVVAISLADCALMDDDVMQVANALREGVQLTMVKLSSNRIGDQGSRAIVDALLTHSVHPLKLIDFSGNRIGAKGAGALSELLTSISHQSQVHSLNISKNSIDGPSLEQLVAAMRERRLNHLISNNQTARYEEEDMDNIFTKLAESLGLSMKSEIGSCSMPSFPALTVKLTGLGGFAGELGRMLDSMAVVTDYKSQRWCHLTTDAILQLVAALRGQDNPSCMFTKEEWDNIIGATKEAPRWLQLADHRDRAVYLSHLPAAITTNKMEGLLETEADCNIDEIVLMKDQLTRKNNGFAWVLFSDVASVDRAVDYFNSGEAKVFGQAFALSRLDVIVNDEGSQQTQAAARDEIDRRAADRAKDDISHRQLLRRSYAESQARHAYRLANPAYADGRIW